jgi:hypothetical protein
VLFLQLQATPEFFPMYDFVGDEYVVMVTSARNMEEEEVSEPRLEVSVEDVVIK